MILRKPYAFFIKHFKIIHLILLLPIGYMIFKSSNIANFFQTLIDNDYLINNNNIAGEYISFFMYLSLVIIIAAGIIIYSLMQEKNKKSMFYIILTMYYVLLFLCTSLVYNQMHTLEQNDAIASTIRVFRDFSKILYYPQYIIAFFTLFRGIGFDIKSFNFSKDLEELELEEQDSEEVEITFGKDSWKYKRKLRKGLREFKYYILENKFVFTCVSVVVLLIIGTSLYMNFEVYNKTYNLNEAFTVNGVIATVNDSYLTTMSYDGKVINEGKYYLAVVIAMANRTNSLIEIEEDNFKLYVDDDYIYPTLSKSGSFMDLGTTYFGGGVRAKSSSEYIFVYELTEAQYRKNYTFKVLDSIVYKPGSLHPKYRIIKLNPEIQTSIEDMGKVKVGSEISLEDTSLKNSKYIINDYSLDNRFDYSYSRCEDDDNCKEYNDSIIATGTNTILKLDADLTLDESCYFYLNQIYEKDFYNNFVEIKYTVNKKQFTTKLKDVTPLDYKKSDRFFEVTKALNVATNIELVITIRNRVATIVLK